MGTLIRVEFYDGVSVTMTEGGGTVRVERPGHPERVLLPDGGTTPAAAEAIAMFIAAAISLKSVVS